MISFGFKTDWAQYSLDFTCLHKIAMECDRGGLDAMWFNDHFFYPPGRADVPTYECWTVMAALAAVTHRLRLGTMVLCNSYRYPSVLAKMAATLDHISGGRLDFGIGAGSFQPDNLAYGLPFYKAPVRISRLREAVQLTKLLWTAEKATYAGEYYTLRDAVCSPKPIQTPHPPIWIGGRGERLMLRVVAELADGCNFTRTTPAEYTRLLSVLERHCLKVGRDFAEIKRSWQGGVHIAEDEQEARENGLRYKAAHWRESTRQTLPEEYFKSSIVGTPDQCIQRLKEYTKIGVTHFLLLFPEVHQGDLSGLQLFAKKVIPAFRED